MHSLTEPGPAEAFQRNDAKSLKGLDPHLSIVLRALPLVFHATHSHANPGVQFVEGFPGGKERCGEVLSCSPNNLVELSNDFSLEVVLAAGQLPNLVFEFQQ